MIFNEQIKIIKQINAIMNSRPEGANLGMDFEIWELCQQLEKLGNAPHIAEVERFRKLYLKEAFKNIPTLEDMEKNYESKQ